MFWAPPTHTHTQAHLRTPHLWKRKKANSTFGPAHYPRSKNIGPHDKIILGYIKATVFCSCVEGEVGDYFRNSVM